ncbi:MAG: four helix bundle protein [Anaerolineales bacterium]|nr:four helix bundle protein [Chloroflexota bacterium]MBL6980757.1 four helix bundle protein [Anaerolineales bacterium]
MKERAEKGFRKLIVWQRAHKLTLLVYKLSESFPKHEMYGLTSQLRRAAASVPANIAEGYALGSSAQYLRHLRIARGSLSEVEYFLFLTRDLEYISQGDYPDAENHRAEVGFLLWRLIDSIEKKK